MRATTFKVFISGVMQGSSPRTAHVHDLFDQDYRARIGAAVLKALPTAETARTTFVMMPRSDGCSLAS
jgi:hypothetical protein